MMNYQDTSVVERVAKFRKIQKARRTNKNKKQNKWRNRLTETIQSVTYENNDDSNAESSKNASDENSTGSNAIQDESRQIRKDKYSALFVQSTKEFDRLCADMENQYCQSCHTASLQYKLKRGRKGASFLCDDCDRNRRKKDHTQFPVWYKEGDARYDVPEELACLREGEKLLIQQVSVFVPLHHLKFGQIGTRGHVVSFSQDLSGLCKTLPRLPDNVETIRVIKKYKEDGGVIQTKTFSIRKQKVLQALTWLQKYNTEYQNIEIDPSNLDWISNGVEEILPATILKETIVPNLLGEANQEDRGPSDQQICEVLDKEVADESFYGLLDEYNEDNPKTKDLPVMEVLETAQKEGAILTEKGSKSVIRFPFVSTDPVCEYTEPRLFELAFPWLFPGGTGGMTTFEAKGKDGIAIWMKKTMLYEDMRFAKDRIWCFFALNFMTRQMNQTSGSFFVKNFFSNGPESLEELKEQMSNGDLSWLQRITYYSYRVTGSSAYWRQKRQEINAWINYHVEQGHGPPTYFITLSCAEYHWKDIERLIKDRCQKVGMPIPDFSSKGRVRVINDYSTLVLEYFQARVKAWLSTVGKKVLLIEHVWGKYEFAPSRGQIHFHFLAISPESKEHMRKCHELLADERRSELAVYLGQWLEDTAGLTAMLDGCASDNDIKNSPHPATYSFSDTSETDPVIDRTKCQLSFQYHSCSQYCMRVRKHPKKNETEDEKKRRYCRCGAGVEGEAGSCLTPGFPTRTGYKIVKDTRGFDRLDMPRNNRRITQSSSYLLRSWRGNVDLQYLIYSSDPDEVDASDISRVTNYVASYCCKGNETGIEEKKNFSDLIHATQEITGDLTDVQRMARKILNECSRKRVISRQEASCQLLRLDLVHCSEKIYCVSLAGNSRLQTEKCATTTFLAEYAKRAHDLKDLSLHQYFHHKHNSEVKQKQQYYVPKIPVYSGSRVEPVYPVDKGYARSVLLLHYPWKQKFDFDDDEDLLLRTFHDLLQDPNRCPTMVAMGYNQAKQSKKMPEPTNKHMEIDYDNCEIMGDGEIEDLVDLVGHIHLNFDASKEDDNDGLDYGKDYDWTQTTIKVKDPETCLEDYLKEYAESRDQNDLGLPLRTDGTEYNIEDLAEDQQKILAEVLEGVKKYVEKDKSEEFETLRMTISGAAGSGKSTWINTLVTVLRKIFQYRQATLVFAPTGCAAYNAGGETIHKGLSVSINATTMKLGNERKRKLMDKLYPAVIAHIFDERGMIDALTLGAARENCRVSAHNGKFQHDAWGGIPIVILAGDDFQLPPILSGAFYALPGTVPSNDSKLNSAQKKMEQAGFEEFRLCGKKVAFLNGGKRVKDDQQQLMRILEATRCEDENVQLSDGDIQRLLELHIYHPRFSRKDREQIEKDALFVFANKEPRNHKNYELLKRQNLVGNPVARIKSRTLNNFGKDVINDTHYELDRTPRTVIISKNAIVSLNGYNPEPAIGLYHGSIGKVIEIVYREGQSPNDDNPGHLPKYVLVEFFQYTGKELVEGMPRVIPIVPVTQYCNKNFCCRRKYLP